MIAQNGPGITNFLTPVKTAYWNHTPLLLVTPQESERGGDKERPAEPRAMKRALFLFFNFPLFNFFRFDHVLFGKTDEVVRGTCNPQAANKTIGQGGFQEVEQMNMFKDCVCYQEEAGCLLFAEPSSLTEKSGQVRDHTRIIEVLNRVIEKAGCDEHCFPYEFSETCPTEVLKKNGS